MKLPNHICVAVERRFGFTYSRTVDISRFIIPKNNSSSLYYAEFYYEFVDQGLIPNTMINTAISVNQFITDYFNISIPVCVRNENKFILSTYMEMPFLPQYFFGYYKGENEYLIL
jgi:hypothetical protein